MSDRIENEKMLDLCKNAEAESDEALYKLGAAYENSADIEQNLEKAYKCYLLALKKGNKNAVRKVLEFTRANFKMQLADIDSKELFKELSEVDFSRFILPADDEKDYQTTRLSLDKQLERLAEISARLTAENPAGEDVETPPVETAEQAEQMLLASQQKYVADCFRQATDTEVPYGENVFFHCELGNIYYSGDYGQTKDQAEAVKWYLLAAVQGSSEAQRCLGRAFELGEGVKPDLTEALKWYRLAAEQGNSEAQERIRELQPDDGQSKEATRKLEKDDVPPKAVREPQKDDGPSKAGIVGKAILKGGWFVLKGTGKIAAAVAVEAAKDILAAGQAGVAQERERRAERVEILKEEYNLGIINTKKQYDQLMKDSDKYFTKEQHEEFCEKHALVKRRLDRDRDFR